MIYLGADHGGFELKEKVKQWLDEWGEKYEDLGAHELDPDDDYTDFSHKVASRVNQENVPTLPWEQQVKGILLCRSGGGMLIAANRYPNVRGNYVFDEVSAKHGRNDNDSNLVSLAGDWVDDESAKAAIRAWLDTPHSTEERHQRRVRALNDVKL